VSKVINRTPKIGSVWQRGADLRVAGEAQVGKDPKDKFFNPKI
jgi:hypothetical protein